MEQKSEFFEKIRFWIFLALLPIINWWLTESPLTLFIDQWVYDNVVGITMRILVGILGVLIMLILPLIGLSHLLKHLCLWIERAWKRKKSQ